MYNENVKKEFIDSYERAKNSHTNALTLERIFRRIEGHEKILNKDVGNFTVNDILEMIPIFESKSAESLQVRVSLLRSYTDWFINHGLSIDFQNHFNEIQFSDLKKYVYENKRYIAPSVLESIIADLKNASDEVIIRGLYEGFEVSDLSQMNIKQVDPESNCVHLISRDIICSDQLMIAIKKSIDETEYNHYGLKKYPTISELESSYVIKDLKSTRLTNDREASLKRRLLKIKDNLEYSNLSLSNLRNSGLINRIINLIIDNDLIETPNRFCNLEEFDNILKKYNLAKQGWFYYSALLKKNLGDNWQEDYLC